MQDKSNRKVISVCKWLNSATSALCFFAPQFNLLFVGPWWHCECYTDKLVFLRRKKNPLTNQKQRNKINKLASVVMFGRWLESRLWVWFPGQQQWGHQEDLRDKRSKNETFCGNLSCRHALWTSFIFHTASGFSCCAPRHVCLIRRPSDCEET